MKCFTYRALVLAALVFLVGAGKPQDVSRLEKLKAVAAKPLFGENLKEYLQLLPANKADFEAMCMTNEEEDCAVILLAPGADLTVIGPRMLSLASQLRWEPDAPNYVKAHVVNLCRMHPREFAQLLKTVKGVKAQDRVFKFMNTNHSARNEELEPCVKNLEAVGLKDLAARARKFYK